MSFLLHSLLFDQARERPEKIAIKYKDTEISYASLASLSRKFSTGCVQAGIQKSGRVGVFLHKSIETVAAFFGVVATGGCLVPINPILKSAQVAHIVGDCDIELLVTTMDRFNAIKNELVKCESLHQIILVDGSDEDILASSIDKKLVSWTDFISHKIDDVNVRLIETDLAAIFYTSGSTGKPKGVVLSHRNMKCGAHSVAEYLENTSSDKILAVLPFSFDYGFSQLTTAFSVGATVVLLDYLFPKDVLKILEREKITGFAAVPPLWQQVSQLHWPESISTHLRYITNSGGALPKSTTDRLVRRLPETDVYLMYGLTEAFRSTYLPPSEVGKRPTSMGKAIPNVEVIVVRPDGEECGPGEAGELVHRGPLVAQGYWNDREKTNARFKPIRIKNREGVVIDEIAVWSGDTVKADEDGFLYFIGRKDDMIKTSGYRVSPGEIEEVACQYAAGVEAVALGVKHEKLGQAIVLVCGGCLDSEHEKSLSKYLKSRLPLYMIPDSYIWLNELPRNSNGKFDRTTLYQQYQDMYRDADEI